jgi:hypothetical protein
MIDGQMILVWWYNKIEMGKWFGAMDGYAKHILTFGYNIIYISPLRSLMTNV